jgi:hypothetical protein
MTEYPKLVGVSRIDTDDTHGWFVRKRLEGRIHSKFFSDNRYGGKKAAYEEAKTFREKLDEKYPPPKTRAFRTRPPSNNSTGVVGVSETYMRSRNGKRIPCFTVTWRPQKGVSKTKKFSILAHGRDEAFRRAVEFRKEMEAEMLRNRKQDDE